MLNFKQSIAEAINRVINNITIKELMNYIENPPNSDMGDYAFPCFRLAKELKQSPQVIANEIKEKIKVNENVIEKIQIEGGYLNFYINKKTLIQEVLEEMEYKKEEFGASNIGEGKNVIVEYSSPNIAKPMHIGHLRNTVIGGALEKLYRFLGYNVSTINYLGDWGINFAKIMAGYTLWKDEYEFAEDPLKNIFKIYVRYNEKEKEDAEYSKLAKEWNMKLEKGDGEALELWNWIKDISIKEAGKIYDLLHCKFDSYNGEAFYNDKMEDIIEELKKKNLLEEYDMPPCIILTSAGTTLYATRDLASIKYRMNNYNFDKAIYVVGSEQQLHLKQVFIVFELMGYGEYAKNCEHVYYGMILDKEGKKMASRKGTSLNLIDLLEEAIEKSKAIIEEKGTDIEDKQKLANQIGIGAIIFNSLYTNKTRDILFDWDSLLNFQGETGPYIQYIYVRTQGVINKAGYVPNLEEVDYTKLQEKEAVNVIKLLYNFEDIIMQVVDKNEPSILARYLIDLSQSFSNFYNEHIIMGDDKVIQNARLYLTNAVGAVLKIGTELLGIEVPDKM